MAPGAVAPTKHTNLLGGREFPAVTWYKDPGLRKLYLLLGTVIMVSATNGFDGSMMNGLQTVPNWKNYFEPSSSERGLLNAILSVGSICAIPISPWLADWRGRRLAITIGITIMFVGVALQTASVNLAMFTASRFLIGFGVSLAHGAAPLLVTELAHYQHRARITSLYNTTWYIGSIIAAWTTYGTFRIDSTWSWRIPSVLQAAPAILMMSFILFVPESPRWLIAHDRADEALDILARYHANGDRHDELVQYEYTEIKETLAIELEVAKVGISELWATRGNRHRMLICICAGFFSQLSGNSLVSYYIGDILTQVGIEDPETQNIINGCLNIWNMLIACGMAFAVDKAGRRPLFLISTGGMCVMFICWTIASKYAVENGSKAAGSAVVALIFLYFTCYNLAWSGLLIGYTVEILPYKIRARGMSVLFMCINLALFFNNYLNPVALERISWKYYIVYCIFLAFEFTVVFFLFVETRYTPLEEIAAYFDDPVAEKAKHRVEQAIQETTVVEFPSKQEA
ncbi:general substrate transporter [Tricharina praecox]|uniref:general substrate transporter n=1 Tax=Tricharina praecox TaxID=43433 RepID=UPI002220921D|nr:general substrate transporter [Tricharina praecox]KAI5841583.1 general substrate transporter [Tricharina praecox]